MSIFNGGCRGIILDIEPYFEEDYEQKKEGLLMSIKKLQSSLMWVTCPPQGQSRDRNDEYNIKQKIKELKRSLKILKKEDKLEMNDKVVNDAYTEELTNAYIFSNIICKGVPLHANYVCSCGFNYGSKFTWIERDWVNEGCPECDSYEMLQNLPTIEKEDIRTFLKVLHT